MNENDIFRYKSIYSFFSEEDEFYIGPEEEGFVICMDGRVQTLLSGESHKWNPKMDKGVMIIQTEADASAVAGTGGIRLSNGQVLGGWCSFSCQLLSPKRFIIHALGLLSRDQRIQSILTETVRGSLHTSFTRIASMPTDLHHLRRNLWIEAKKQTKSDLLRLGWQLMGFRLEHMQIKQEGAYDKSILS